MPRTGTIITNTKKDNQSIMRLVDTENIPALKKGPKQLRKDPQSECVLHYGCEPITYSEFVKRIREYKKAVSPDERARLPHPVILLKRDQLLKKDALILQWYAQPEPDPLSWGFCEDGSFCMTANLLGYYRIDLEFLHSSVRMFRSEHKEEEREVFIRPTYGPRTLKVSF